MDALTQDRVAIDEFEDGQELLIHIMIALMNLASKNVVSVTIEQNLLEHFWALKW